MVWDSGLRNQCTTTPKRCDSSCCCRCAAAVGVHAGLVVSAAATTAMPDVRLYTESWQCWRTFSSNANCQ